MLCNELYFSDDEAKKKFHKGSKYELLLNDLLQHILEKQGVQNRREWRVYISKEPQINACAHPGGVIVFYEPILTAFENVDQLAMVMCHEVSHCL